MNLTIIANNDTQKFCGDTVRMSQSNYAECATPHMSDNWLQHTAFQFLGRRMFECISFGWSVFLLFGFLQFAIIWIKFGDGY